jgi:hypothetical protein
VCTLRCAATQHPPIFLDFSCLSATRVKGGSGDVLRDGLADLPDSVLLLEVVVISQSHEA